MMIAQEIDHEPEATQSQVIDLPMNVGADLPYKEARAHMIAAFERRYVQGILERCDGNVSMAARNAGIDRVYLHRLIKKYHLGRQAPRPVPQKVVSSASS